MPTTSAAGRDRARRHDQALDAERVRTGQDRNRAAADTQPRPALSDAESLALPNTNQRRVRR
jgi:hypothetical protein